MDISEAIKKQIGKLSVEAISEPQQTETPKISEIMQFKCNVLGETDLIEKKALFKAKFIQILQSLVSVKLQFSESEKILMNNIFERSLNRIHGIPQKGIYLFANSDYKAVDGCITITGNGTGKTKIMRAVVLFERYCNLAFSAPSWQMNDFKSIIGNTPDYVNCSFGSDVVRRTGVFPPECFYNNMLFDEVGKEPDFVKHFGNDINFFVFILEQRYQIVESKGLLFSTNFTSNLPPQKLIEKYGTHVYDRLIEMVDFIELQGESKRR